MKSNVIRQKEKYKKVSMCICKCAMELLLAQVVEKLIEYHNDLFTVAKRQLNTLSLVGPDNSVVVSYIVTFEVVGMRLTTSFFILEYSLNRRLMSL